MRLLWIATKPPLPPVDGGRLVAVTTLTALAREGVQIDLVTPVSRLEGVQTAGERELGAICRPHFVPVPRRARAATVVRAALVRRPFSIAHHAHASVRRRVHELLAAHRFDAVHVEQVQALEQANPALRRGEPPVVLRAQNVESELWRGLAGPWMAWEARRLAAFERRAVRRVAMTVTLTERDAGRLRELAGPEANVVAVPPPFPARLPAGTRRLSGEPPLILMGSGGWRPNRDANHWFLSTVWAQVRAQVPSAVLHLFGPEAERPPLPLGVTAHPPPADSGEAFVPGGIMVVPLRVGSGVRMKILEAWARGLCVVATPEAVAGLEMRDGRELLVARDAAGFAAAIRLLADDPARRAGLISAGRHALEIHHDPAAAARRLIEIYRTAVPSRLR